MTRDDILRMARKAGWPSMAVDNLPGTQEMSRLERFSAQVAAHEREQCARVLDDQWFKTQSECAAAIRARGEK